MKNKKRLFGALVIAILALTMIATLAACGEEETVQYTVTLKSGFDDQVTTQTLNEGEVFTLPASPFTRDGYTFDYWTEEGTTYPNQVGTPIPVYRNMTFVAHWTENYVPDVPEDFTVTVKDGYGSGQITAVVTEGEEYVLPAADTFTRPEYTFGGWQVGDSVMAAGDSVTITANTEIIAVWNAIPKYNVSVLKGYGDNAPIATYVVTSGGSYTLPEMTLDYADHNFLGYADLSGDLTEYIAAGTVIENITSDKTFVAMWEEITYYTVYLKKTADATGTDVDNSNRVTEGGSFVLPECNFVNAGYVFKAWLYDGEEVQPGFTIENVVSDIDVIAVWELAEEPQPETYSVSFTDGLYTRPGGSYTEGTAYTIPLDSDTYFSKADYKLIGWTVAGDDSGKVYKPGESYNGNANVVFEAKWEQIVYYTVTLSDGAGKNETVASVESGTVYEYILPAADKFSREGYTFAGWKIGEETYSAGETVNLTMDKNITITAVWEAIPTYTVTYYYELNGTQISVSSAMYSGTEYDLIDYPADQTPPTGMKFDGWKLVGGDETVYPAGTRITVSGNAGYYAVYRDAVFTVAFYSDNAETASYEIAEGGNCLIPAAPEKTGYTFLGWYLNGEGEAIQGEYVHNVTTDMRFEAKWQINSYEITFNVRNESETVTVNYGETPVCPLPYESYETYNKTFTFNGWYPALEPATEDRTYTATYTEEPKKFDVFFTENEHIEFLVDGEAVNTYKVVYGGSLDFALQAAPGVYLDNVSVYGGEQLLTAVNGIYTISNITETVNVRAGGEELATYNVYVSGATNANYEVIAEDGMTYGKEISVKVWGDEGYRKNAPAVTVDEEERAHDRTTEENGITYYYYDFVLDGNIYMSISVKNDTITITYIDIANKKYTQEWSLNQGPIGQKEDLEAIGIKLASSTGVNNWVYEGNTGYCPLTGFANNTKVLALLTTDEKERTYTLEGSAYDYADEQASAQYNDKENFEPSVDTTYYIRYYIKPTTAVQLSVVLPADATDIKYFYYPGGEGEGELRTWIAQGDPVIGYEENYIFYTDENNTDSAFATGDKVFVTMTLPKGGKLPAIYNELTGAIMLPSNKVIGGETVSGYDITIGNFDLQYLPASDEGTGYHTVTILPSDYPDQQLYTSNITSTKVKNGSSLTFTLNIKANNKVDINAIISGDNGNYALIPDISEIMIVNGDWNGEVTYTITKVDLETTYSNGAVIEITVSNITDTIEISFDLPPQHRLIPLTLGDGYDWYINGVKVDGINFGEFDESIPNIVWAPVCIQEYVELRLHDDIPYNFLKVDGKASIQFTYTYKDIQGAEETKTIYGGVISDSGKSIAYKFTYTTFKDISEFTTTQTLTFLSQKLGWLATQLTDLCATTGSDKLSIINENGYDVYFVNDQNTFEITIQAPLGTIPVLYVERADKLDDSFRKYYAVSVADQGNYLYNYTFTINGLTSEIKWYIDTEVEEFDVTIVNGDGTEIELSVPYGTKVTDIEGLPTYYILSTETGTEFYRVYGWSATQGGAQLDENAVVAGDATYYALGEVTEAALSFTYDGGVEFYNTLADALNSDIVKNNAGVLDIFYGKTDESLTEGAYTIPANVTLRLPYATGEYGRGYGGTSGVSKFYADKADGFTSLVIGEGATLNVAGKISVGGIIGYAASAMPYQGQTSGKHAVLELNGTINVLSGGALYVNGYIVGTGTVELATGGASYLPFIVKDYRGGTNTDRMYSLGITPFNIYEMPNIQTNYIINYGAVEYAYAVLYASNMFNETIAEVIGTNGIIKLAEGGKVVKKTTEIENPRYSTETVSYEPQYEYRTTLDIYGGGNDGFLSLDILGLVTVTTEDFFLGIPYTYQRITLHDGEYSIVNKFKVMPGATLEIADDATLTIESTGAIAVYEDDFDETQWTTQLNNRLQLAYPVNPNRIPAGDGVMAESGVLKVAGTLVINGSFGGLITGDDSVGVSETLPTIIVGETGVNKALSLTMKEGIYLNGNGYVFNATYIDPETGKDKVLVAMAGDKTLEYALPGQTMQFTYENGIWSK